MIIEEARDVCGSKFNVSKTEEWLGCPLLADGSVCVGGGPLVKLFVMGCLSYLRTCCFYSSLRGACWHSIQV